MTMENSRKNESWKKLRVLGSGGFGQVTLWYNSLTGQKIAIKKLHEHASKDTAVWSKQTERWSNEVEIMKKLNHINIVATLEVPSELNIITQLPVLAMEYCSEGDLRQVLNKPENCCGLKEPEVLDILKDVSSGLAYLHSCKIIHRDLKPDNIVLQKRDSFIIYKLIDLGYAKSLDQCSLSKSFVGTIQYIAPELFMGKVYTSSVDYWSFGLLAHEIITGYRPFLPGHSPSDWMKKIQNKARDVINVFENNDGSIVYSSRISRRNHLTRCFLEDIEKWLQLALDWDGQTRGRDSDGNRPVIFEELANILRKKVIKIFSVPTCETLSYELDSNTDVANLKDWIKKDTELEVEDQILLLPSGHRLDSNGCLLRLLKNEVLDRKSLTMFLYNSGTITLKSKAAIIPSFVEDLINSAAVPLTYRRLKRNCADSVYFLQLNASRYCNLLQGIRVKINNTKKKTSTIESIYEEIGEEWNQIEVFGQFLFFSHKIDLENYINYRKTGMLRSSAFVKKWIQNVIDVNNKIMELKNSYNKSEQRQLVLIARQRCRSLENCPGSEVLQKTSLDDIANKSLKLWTTIQKMPRDARESLLTNSSAADLVNLSIEQNKKFLSNQRLTLLFLKISEVDENLEKFLSHLSTLLKSLKILKLVIENTQKERQKEVWNLISDVGNRSENGRIGDAESAKCSVRLGNGEDSEEDDKEDKTSGYVSSLNESHSIIDNNNRLRHRIQQIQLDCVRMMKKMNSFDWDVPLEPAD